MTEQEAPLQSPVREDVPLLVRPVEPRPCCGVGLLKPTGVVFPGLSPTGLVADRLSQKPSPMQATVSGSLPPRPALCTPLLYRRCRTSQGRWPRRALLQLEIPLVHLWLHLESHPMSAAAR